MDGRRAGGSARHRADRAHGRAAGRQSRWALQATARWSFILFWCAYTGNALAVVFGPRFQAIAHRCRDFALVLCVGSSCASGLGRLDFAHFSDAQIGRSALIVFGIAVFWTYLLALLSIKRLAAKFDPKLLRALRTIGVEYIALAFLVDFAKNPFQGGIGILSSTCRSSRWPLPDRCCASPPWQND